MRHAAVLHRHAARQVRRRAPADAIGTSNPLATAPAITVSMDSKPALPTRDRYTPGTKMPGDCANSPGPVQPELEVE